MPIRSSVIVCVAMLFVAVVDARAEEARITVLYDAFGKPSSLKKDWGFAALIEYGGKRILFDTGNNAAILAHNVKTLNVDLLRLDFAVISHRHGDHVGGLTHLLAVNPQVPIFAPREGFGVFGAELPRSFLPANEALPPYMRYWDGAPAERLRFGTAWPQGNFTLVGATTEIAPGFHIVALKGEWGTDLPLVELSLVIETADGIVVVAGCSHPTIERIVTAAKAVVDKPIHLVIGGMHLIPAPPQELERIARALRDDWQVHWLAPAHCTGEPAFERLRNAFADNYLYAGLGTTLPLAGASLAGMQPHLPHRAEYEVEPPLEQHARWLASGHPPH